jgi:peptidoglycan LD-endopeptidase CwlK
MKFSQRSLMRMEGVDPRLREIMNLAINLTKVDFGIPPYGGIRTAKEQSLLFKEGKSKADGYKKLSKHQSGKALDVYAYVDGKASWEEEHLSMVACAVLQAASRLGYALDWGGLWKWQDMPHFELRENK